AVILRQGASGAGPRSPSNPRHSRRMQSFFGSKRLRGDHPGSRRWHDRGVEVVPFAECVGALDRWV
ncbi:MAG: hypothetical protein L6Q95_18705, partial [Planctomycetes bacterium]|nr:hypothetical protein [Planctomycetota bacterium]